jgi:hypothetical protein
VRLSTHLFYNKYFQCNEDNDSLYGCGKASDYQLQTIKLTQNNELSDKLETP